MHTKEKVNSFVFLINYRRNLFLDEDFKCFPDKKTSSTQIPSLINGLNGFWYVNNEDLVMSHSYEPCYQYKGHTQCYCREVNEEICRGGRERTKQ